MPGDTTAIPLTRAFLLVPMSGVADQHPDVEQTGYVDDFGQIVWGTFQHVVSVLAPAAHQFVVAARLLGLPLSTKVWGLGDCCFAPGYCQAGGLVCQAAWHAPEP